MIYEDNLDLIITDEFPDKKRVELAYKSLIILDDLKKLENQEDYADIIEEHKFFLNYVSKKDLSKFNEDIVKQISLEIEFDRYSEVWNDFRVDKNMNVNIIEEFDISIDLEEKLDKLLEKKHYELMRKVTKTTITKSLYNEYLRKEELAKEAYAKDDFSIFDNIKDKNGLSNKEYCELILDKAKEWHKIEDIFYLKSGELRSLISKKIRTNDLENIDNLFKELRRLEIISN